MIRPAHCRHTLFLDVLRRHFPVHLDFDHQVAAIGFDDDEVRVVLLSSRVPEDWQLVDMESHPAFNAVIVVDHVGDRSLRCGVEPLNWKQ